MVDSSVEKILAEKGKIVDVVADKFAITALKRREDDNALILRGYNLSNHKQPFVIKEEVRLLNLLEEEIEGNLTNLAPNEIKTLLIKEKK